MGTPGWLSSSPHAYLLEGLHMVAWTDGRLDQQERLMLLRLIGRLNLQPPPGEFQMWVESAPQGSVNIPEEDDSFNRRFLLSSAIEMAYEDGEYSEHERATIIRWATVWGVSADEVSVLEDEILAERAGPEGF